MVFSFIAAKLRNLRLLYKFLLLLIGSSYILGGIVVVFALTNYQYATEVAENELGDQFSKRLNGLTEVKSDYVNAYFENIERRLLSTSDSLTIGQELSDSINDSLDQSLRDSAHTRITNHFQTIIDHEEIFDIIYFTNSSGNLRIFTIKEEMAVTPPPLGTNYSTKPFIVDAWTNRFESNYFAFKDVHYSVNTDAYITFFSKAIEYNSEFIGVLTLRISLDNLWKQLAFVDDDGTTESDEYHHMGLGETGEIYLVHAKSMKGISLSRFLDIDKFVMNDNITINTTGITEASINGKYQGYYLNYLGYEVLGNTYYLGPELADDLRNAFELEISASFGLDWILVIEIEKDEIFSPVNELWAQFNQAIINLFIFFNAVTIVIIFITFMFGKSLTQPIENLVRVSNEIAKNDLSIKIESGTLTRNDEIGKLEQSYSKMVDKLRETVKTVQTSSVQVAVSAEQLASSSEEVNALSEEITTTIQQISSGASKQSDIAADTISEVTDIANTTQEAITDINSIIAIIEDVASQTNILALNAAIEAARAGEFGRGFAVVADNVRRLAEDTKNNVSQITELINNINNNIVLKVERASDSIQNLAAQSEEFSASSEEVAASTEEQSAAMQEMAASAIRLTSLSNELESLVKEFQLEEKD